MAEIIHSKPPPMVMLNPVATVISIFFEIILVIIPPKAPHNALRIIIPSPLKEIPCKKFWPGWIFISNIPLNPNIHPNALNFENLSSSKIMQDNIMAKNPFIESSIVDLELGR